MKISLAETLIFMCRNFGNILLGAVVLMLLIGNAWFWMGVP